MNKLWFILAAVIGVGCAADGSHAPDAPEDADEEKVSGITLSLFSTDSQGRAYRLRNATFTVDSQDYYFPYDGGAPPPHTSTQLSTETDPDADRLSVRLVPGPYQVSLGGDWYIERLSAAGSERVEQVVLLTDAVQYAYVGDNWNYDVNFRFGVDGTLIDFRHGDLGIDIGIELPGDNQYPSYDGGVVFPTDASVEQPLVDASIPIQDGSVIILPLSHRGALAGVEADAARRVVTVFIARAPGALVAIGPTPAEELGWLGLTEGWPSRP